MRVAVCVFLALTLLSSSALSVSINEGVHLMGQPDAMQSESFVKVDGINSVVALDGLIEIGPDGRTPIIIKIKGEPIGPHFRKLGIATVREKLSKIKSAHERVIGKLTELTNKPRGKALSFKPSSGKLKVKYHYFKAFNGIAVDVYPDDISEISSLPDVEKICYDTKVKVTLGESVPMINTPDVWSAGYTGTGITVAVVDTGIDYTHPDLGSGFGQGYKVVGGYDFVNGDNDPMDDNGHGTHVAGIIAADGGIRGVAPGVQLLAYKVLDATGFGWSHNIAAAIDRAIDPDDNPATDDGADIINLSLGNQTGMNDVTVEAVENATRCGVLCVASAGNSGKPGSIGAPGCAPSALTVGAVDKSDQIASYSSRGPGYQTYHPKPDCLAPGTGIV